MCLGHLLDGLMSPCQQSVVAVCFVLVDAIDRGFIAREPVMKSLITSCASMPHWMVGLNTLGKVMINNIKSIHSSESVVCPFSLRYSYSICLLFVLMSVFQEFATPIYICF